MTGDEELLRLVRQHSEVADPEQSIQLHDLQGDGVGEQILCLKNIQKTKTSQLQLLILSNCVISCDQKQVNERVAQQTS